MEMERILIIGCSGSGKSRMARILGKKLDLPVVHLDQLWWKCGWENVTVEEFDARMQAVLETDRWIIDGNFSRTMPQRIEHCDTILYLDYSRWLCLLGMLQRVIGSYGKVRPDMAEGCPERFDRDFVLWIWNFNRENRDRNYFLINSAKHANTIVLKNRWQTNRFLRKL